VAFGSSYSIIRNERKAASPITFQIDRAFPNVRNGWKADIQLDKVCSARISDGDM
jgi:hypothetical protein